MSQQKQYTGYPEINAAAQRLARALTLGFEKSEAAEVVLLTFCRGGLNTTAAVARYLTFKPVVLALGPTTPIPPPHALLPGRSIFPVVVDDILDTGKTVQRLTRNSFWSESLHLFLYDKPGPHRIYTPKTYAVGADKTVPANSWLVFVWESEEAEQALEAS